MAGMWELPEVAAVVPRARKNPVPFDKLRTGSRFARNDEDGELLFAVRHSITVTDYAVQVWRSTSPAATIGEWIAVERLERVALTGLARKILRKAGIIAASGTQV
jgi:hypothetical protein